jgi:hypothetical protein
MTRLAAGLAVGLLFCAPAWGDTAVPPVPVVYGAAPAFWDTHTLIDAVVDADRLEDDGKSLFAADHPHFHQGDRILLLAEKGRVSLREDLTSYAMMPGGAEMCSFPKDDDPAVPATEKLCRALAEKNAGERLGLLGEILKDKPDERVRGVLRRALR